MKKTKLLALTLIVFCFIPNESTGQDMQFTQYYSAPMYLNPALTGFNVCSRLSSNIRNQWPSIGGGYVSQILGFDHFIINQSIGIGVMATNDFAGAGRLRSTAVSGLTSYELNATRNLTFRFGMQGGIIQRSVNFNSLVFADQIARGGSSIPTIEQPTQNVIMIDFSSGVFAFYKKYFGGIALHHLTKPNESLTEDDAGRPMKFSLHGGGKFKFGPPVDDEETQQMYITPTFNYRSQAKYDQLDIGFYWSRHIYNVGLWYRGLPGVKSYKDGYPNNDALCLVLGISKDRFNVGYSYDYTISWLQGNTGGSHELSLSYQLCKLKRKKKKRIVVVCPKF